MDREAFVRTMQTLERRHPFRDWSRGMSAFEVLVSTILSQSTTVANERLGLDGLRQAFGVVTPVALRNARVEEIERAIWHAGLARQKAPRIQAVALEVQQRWGGDLNRVLDRPTREAREALMSFRGVGPKTADVVLAMAGSHPTFPVDTHIARIARRWELARRRGYEPTREALEAWTPPSKRRAWHLAIIAHGRELCKARKPKCEACPVRRDCDWYRDQRNGRDGAPRQRTKG